MLRARVLSSQRISAMPISTTCPGCKAIFRLAEELAGKKVKCQKCQGLFVVPTGEGGTIEPGIYVPEERKRAVVASSVAKAESAPTRPEDIPMMARVAANDEIERDQDDERRAPSKPRRNERRPRRDDNPKPKSGLLPIVLVLCGLGLFSCILLIGVMAFWHLAAEAPRQRPIIGGRNRKQAFAQKDFAQNGLPGGFNRDPVRPVNNTPATEIKLGADGIFRQESELTVQDSLNPDNKRHKHYAIQLEEGKRYQIDLEVPLNPRALGQNKHFFDAFLFLVDDANKIVAENDDIEQGVNQNSRIIHACTRTATYKIEATFFDNLDGQELGPFTLTVRELK
jgi:predicted Zn finger-like uncharacterized protein